MNAPQDGGPAFPQHLAFTPNGEAALAGMYFAEGPGMSLRDWFAGKAIVASAKQVERTIGRIESRSVAERAYEIADAMLATRKGE